jgi:hypothetical protein
MKSRVSDLGIYEKHVQVLMEKLPEDGVTVDIADLFLRYTMDVTTDFLFGRSTNSLNNPRERFTEAFAEVQRMQNIFVRAGYTLWGPLSYETRMLTGATDRPANPIIPRTSFRKALKVLNEFIEPYIDEVLEHNRNSKAEVAHDYTFLHALAKYTQDRKVLRDQLVAMLLAGRVSPPGIQNFRLPLIVF